MLTMSLFVAHMFGLLADSAGRGRVLCLHSMAWGRHQGILCSPAPAPPTRQGGSGAGPATRSHPVHPQGGVRGESQEDGAQTGITCPTGTLSDEVEGPSQRGPATCVVNTLLSLWDEMGLHVTLRLDCGAVRGDSCSREQGLASLTVRP